MSCDLQFRISISVQKMCPLVVQCVGHDMGDESCKMTKKKFNKKFSTCEDCIGVYKLCTVVMRQLRPEFKFPAKIEMDFSDDDSN